MKAPSLTTAVIAGAAGITAIGAVAEAPMIDPYYRIGGGGGYPRYTRHKQRSVRNFDAAKRRKRNKAAKAARARNRK